MRSKIFNLSQHILSTKALECTRSKQYRFLHALRGASYGIIPGQLLHLLVDEWVEHAGPERSLLPALLARGEGLVPREA